jgi:uncharacterized protein YndB with AHSA1/START domain
MSRDGRLTTIDGRPALRFERRLGHAPERVWRAVSEPDELSAWFVAPIDVDRMEPGATFEAMGQTGRVTDVRPGELLAWTWGTDDFTFEVRADGDGSVLTFTHVFDDRDHAAHTAGGWDLHFVRLEALLDGREVPSVDSLSAMIEPDHEHYAEAFGIDLDVSRAKMREAMEDAGVESSP